MLILIAVTVNFGRGAIRTAKLEDIRTSMITMQSKAKIIKEKYDFKEIPDLVGTKLNSIPDWITDSDGQELYKWDKGILDTQGLRKCG